MWNSLYHWTWSLYNSHKVTRSSGTLNPLLLSLSCKNSAKHNLPPPLGIIHVIFNDHGSAKPKLIYKVEISKLNSPVFFGTWKMQILEKRHGMPIYCSAYLSRPQCFVIFHKCLWASCSWWNMGFFDDRFCSWVVTFSYCGAGERW